MDSPSPPVPLVGAGGSHDDDDDSFQFEAAAFLQGAAAASQQGRMDDSGAAGGVDVGGADDNGDGGRGAGGGDESFGMILDDRDDADVNAGGSGGFDDGEGLGRRDSVAAMAAADGNQHDGSGSGNEARDGADEAVAGALAPSYGGPSTSGGGGSAGYVFDRANYAQAMSSHHRQPPPPPSPSTQQQRMAQGGHDERTEANGADAAASASAPVGPPANGMTAGSSSSTAGTAAANRRQQQQQQAGLGIGMAQTTTTTNPPAPARRPSSAAGGRRRPSETTSVKSQGKKRARNQDESSDQARLATLSSADEEAEDAAAAAADDSIQGDEGIVFQQGFDPDDEYDVSDEEDDPTTAGSRAKRTKTTAGSAFGNNGGATDETSGAEGLSSGFELVNDKDGVAMRRKIRIQFIKDRTRRHITFSKRKSGIMKKAYELSILTGTQVLLLIVSETGLVYTYATAKLQPLVKEEQGRELIKACLTAPDAVGPNGQPNSLAPLPQPATKKGKGGLAIRPLKLNAQALASLAESAVHASEGGIGIQPEDATTSAAVDDAAGSAAVPPRTVAIAPMPPIPESATSSSIANRPKKRMPSEKKPKKAPALKANGRKASEDMGQPPNLAAMGDAMAMGQAERLQMHDPSAVAYPGIGPDGRYQQMSPMTANFPMQSAPPLPPMSADWHSANAYYHSPAPPAPHPSFLQHQHQPHLSYGYIAPPQHPMPPESAQYYAHPAQMMHGQPR